MQSNNFIDFLIENDPLGLLKGKQEPVRKVSGSVLLNNFEEIVEFYEDNGHEPQNSIKNIREFQLYCRLKSIRTNPAMVKELKKFDYYGLLKGENISDVPFEDLIGNDPFNLLSGDYEDSIFQLNYVKPSDRISPEYIARRKFCSDFERYKPMFESLREDLENGKRKLAIYRSHELQPDSFYVLGGIIVYLKSVNGQTTKYPYKSGARVRYDGRTECIFDNGTISDMLYRSLDKALQKEGYAITDYCDNSNLLTDNIVEGMDIPRGYVYVLKTHNPKLRSIRDIYKIGSTTTTVTERIKNANKEATYLYADVEVVETYRCFNISPRDLEDRLQTFFDMVRLNINIPDEHGAIISPREWFCVNVDVISEAVGLIINKKIDDYVYDPSSRSIIAKHTNRNSECAKPVINMMADAIYIGTVNNNSGSEINDNSLNFNISQNE